MKLLLASNNRHKLEEIKAILGSDIELCTPSDLGMDIIDVDETGDTLESNAELKAREFYYTYGIPCIADDTGLEVDALSGLPGVRSARFAGEPADDAANRRKLLEMLSDVPPELRTARFRTVICEFDGKSVRFFVGVCEGIIIDHERGNNGFGYDSIFQPLGYELSFAELTAEEKNAISHRKNALLEFCAYIK